MLPIASPREIASIALAGCVVDAALREAMLAAREGMTTREVAAAAERVIVGAGAVPVLLGYAAGGTGVLSVPSASGGPSQRRTPSARPQHEEGGRQGEVCGRAGGGEGGLGMRGGEGTGETPVPPALSPVLLPALSPALSPASSPGFFPAAACVCVGEQAVHGVPGERVLRAGEVVTIDVACALADERGRLWHADGATCVVVDGQSTESRARELCERAHSVTAHAVGACQAGTRWSEVVRSTQTFVREAGGSLLAGYHGHGIGAALHQAPTAWFAPLPHEQAGPGALPDFELLPGMVLCVEPIVSLSKHAPTLVLGSDGWSVLTRDRSATAFVECCVAITRQGPVVLAGGCKPR